MPGVMFEDTTYTKVFVGGLAWETQRETMRRYFEQFGEILEAVVITDKNTGRSKGYGFVTFRDAESARRACADASPVIDGRRANCNLASLGVRARGSPQSGFRFRPGSPYRGGPPVAGPFFQNNPPAASAQPCPLPPQAFAYPNCQYGYPTYPPDFVYPQYDPYIMSQLSQYYGNPMYQYFGYGGAPAMGPPSMVQYGGPGFNVLTSMPQPSSSDTGTPEASPQQLEHDANGMRMTGQLCG